MWAVGLCGRSTVWRFYICSSRGSGSLGLEGLVAHCGVPLAAHICLARFATALLHVSRCGTVLRHVNSDAHVAAFLRVGSRYRIGQSVCVWSFRVMVGLASLVEHS